MAFMLKFRCGLY